MREEVNHGRTGIKFLNELEALEKRAGKEKRQLTSLYAEAESKAGKPWAKRLQSLTALQAQYGAKGHTLIELQEKSRDKMGELTRAGLKQSGMWNEAREELQKYLRLSERFAEVEAGLTPRRQSAVTPGEHGHRVPGGSPTPPKQRNGSAHPRGKAAGRRNTLFAPNPKRLSLDGERVIELHNHVTVVSELDGKKVAENTTRQSQRATNRS
jgi:hypothetical protein